MNVIQLAQHCQDLIANGYGVCDVIINGNNGPFELSEKFIEVKRVQLKDIIVGHDIVGQTLIKNDRASLSRL